MHESHILFCYHKSNIIFLLRSKTPTARLKLKGITVQIHEKSNDFQYLILLKKTKTKLVLNADTSPEFDGWYKTIKGICNQKQEEEETTETSEDKNVEDDRKERGRQVTKNWGKTPVPTPRNRTPSRDKSKMIVEPAEKLVKTSTESTIIAKEDVSNNSDSKVSLL